MTSSFIYRITSIIDQQLNPDTQEVDMRINDIKQLLGDTLLFPTEMAISTMPTWKMVGQCDFSIDDYDAEDRQLASEFVSHFGLTDAEDTHHLFVLAHFNQAERPEPKLFREVLSVDGAWFWIYSTQEIAQRMPGSLGYQGNIKD